ncbi:MAG: DNA polymerase III subunit delta', partial [Dehalococcoidia bacterium]|nr:DNA polymerase III subunit delta' [Dehalococcoidia bacterium]
MWPIVGHEMVVSCLEKALAKGKLGHAYLFCGPPHSGKLTLALTLAQALNCLQPKAPCGVCSVCQRIASFAHPDIRVIALGGTES